MKGIEMGDSNKWDVDKGWYWVRMKGGEWRPTEFDGLNWLMHCGLFVRRISDEGSRWWEGYELGERMTPNEGRKPSEWRLVQFDPHVFIDPDFVVLVRFRPEYRNERAPEFDRPPTAILGYRGGADAICYIENEGTENEPAADVYARWLGMLNESRKIADH